MMIYLLSLPINMKILITGLSTFPIHVELVGRICFIQGNIHFVVMYLMGLMESHRLEF